MSPTSSSSSIYDHLMINFHQQPKMIMRNNTSLSNTPYEDSSQLFSLHAKSHRDNSILMNKIKSFPINKDDRSKRRFTITHVTLPEPMVCCSVSNHAYDKAIIHKPSVSSNISSTWKETNSKYCQSPISKNIEGRQMDFRPLITNGRRRFSTIASAPPMIIVKKKSSSPMNNVSVEQKQLRRSIPVNVTTNNAPIVVSTVITSSSVSSSSSSVTSTNGTTVFVPIQVTKTRQNYNQNNNTYSTISTTTITDTLKESQKGYRYVPNKLEQVKTPTTLKKKNTQASPLLILTDDDNGSTRISSSVPGDDGDENNNSMMITDSNVLRLIRRYDPIGADTIALKNRRSVDNNRRAWPPNSQKPLSSMPASVSSSSCSFFSPRTPKLARDDHYSLRETLQVYPQIQSENHEQHLSSNKLNPTRPILKYASPKPISENNSQPKIPEPLTIEIEPNNLPPMISNENGANYQSLITTGTKRVCAAISKSEWDLRFQHDPPSPIVSQSQSPPPFPVQIVSPPTTINQQKVKESYQPLINRNETSINNNNNINEEDDHIDDFQEISSISTPASCVAKLKQLFNTKSSLDSPTSPTSPIHKQRSDNSMPSNLNRHLNKNGASVNKSDLLPLTPSLVQKLSNSHSFESHSRTISADSTVKPTIIIQEAVPTSSPLLKRPILKSQKTLDNAESLNCTNTSIVMPSSELTYDAYRFRRLNDQDAVTGTRLRNVAKVEPYSINTNMLRPLYQLASSSQVTTTTQPSKPLNIPNSTGNTPTNSSTSSSVASLCGTIRHPNVRNSDFLTPNPAYSTPPPPPPHTSQPPSNSSSSYVTPPSTSMLLSESLVHDSSRRLPTTNNSNSLYNVPSNSLTSSINNSQFKYRSPTKQDAYSKNQTYSPATYLNGQSTTVNNNKNNKYEKFDNYTPLNSYQYRPREYTASTTAINTLPTNAHCQSQPSGALKTVEQQQYDRSNNAQQQPRRRFQRRKQMKRSKSADLYNEPSSTSSKLQNQNDYYFPPTSNLDSNRYHRQQRSISRDLPGGGGGGDGHLSSSSSSSLSTANIERINRAALLRYKSLDSMTFNNRKSNLNGKNDTRRALSKPINADFDSDDSVCGIPKPRKATGR